MPETASPPAPRPRSSPSRPIMAGVVTALVGFTSSFAVVLTGLAAVGATHAQAASGLLALCLTMGVAGIVLAWRYRMPITSAWSTPGAALLAASGAIEGGWPAAVGAFLIVAALILLTALVPQLGSLIAAIPPSIAQAMLAGVLLPLCLAPIGGLAKNPWAVVPVLLTWLVFARLAPRWAVPLAFLAATVVIVIGIVTGGSASIVDPAALLPHLELTMIHEAMVLEQSGRDLAWVDLASWLRLSVLLGLVGNLLLPWGVAATVGIGSLLLGTLALAGKLALLAALLFGASTP
ncbi:MAG: hypothetical protein B7X41_11595, partial [Microbacterium sp. 14-71-5]